MILNCKYGSTLKKFRYKSTSHGAMPTSNLLYPFVFNEGIAEQSYMIQLIGDYCEALK